MQPSQVINPRRVWYWPPWTLTAPVLGVPRSRPPLWFGGDEYGRSTVVIQLPLLGALVIAKGKPISTRAWERICWVDEMEDQGVLTAEQAERRRQGYRYIGEREMAGLPPINVTTATSRST